MPDLEREQHYFERLRLALPELLAAPFQRREAPDYLIEIGDRTVGVELTEYHTLPLGDARPASEVAELMRRVIARAQEMHAALGGPPLYVKCAFRHGVILQKRDVEMHASALAQAVLATPQPISIADQAGTLAWDNLPEFAAKVWRRASVDGNDLLWSPVEVGWVSQIGSEHVAALIERKNGKVERYREVCDEIWLTIVHYNGMRDFSELSWEASLAQDPSRFDRVLWLNSLIPAVQELAKGAA